VLFFFDSDFSYVFLLFFLTGFIFFGWVYARYRNTGKHHDHVNETSTEIRNLRKYDQLAEHRRKLSNGHMHGTNDTLVEGTISKHATKVAHVTGKDN
jgi:hypothetical protein